MPDDDYDLFADEQDDADDVGDYSTDPFEILAKREETDNVPLYFQMRG